MSVFHNGSRYFSEPYIPNIKGINDFKGQSWHTSNWPKEEVKTSNKRIGVIGTGATGVQLITELAKDVEELYVFQLNQNIVFRCITIK